MRRFGRGWLVGLAAMVCLSSAGCNTQQTVAEVAQTLTVAASNVAQLEGNAALSAKLQADGSAIAAAIQNWKSGTPAQEAIEAIAVLEDDLSLIPATSQYTALIDLALGAAQSLLELLPTTATPTKSVTLTAVAKSSFMGSGQVVTAIANTPLTVHKARVVAPVKVRSKADFVKKWNAIATAHPEMAPAVIAGK